MPSLSGVAPVGPAFPSVADLPTPVATLALVPAEPIAVQVPAFTPATMAIANWTASKAKRKKGKDDEVPVQSKDDSPPIEQVKKFVALDPTAHDKDPLLPNDSTVWKPPVEEIDFYVDDPMDVINNNDEIL